MRGNRPLFKGAALGIFNAPETPGAPPAPTGAPTIQYVFQPPAVPPQAQTTPQQLQEAANLAAYNAQVAASRQQTLPSGTPEPGRSATTDRISALEAAHSRLIADNTRLRMINIAERSGLRFNAAAVMGDTPEQIDASIKAQALTQQAMELEVEQRMVARFAREALARPAAAPAQPVLVGYTAGAVPAGYPQPPPRPSVPQYAAPTEPVATPPQDILQDIGQLSPADYAKRRDAIFASLKSRAPAANGLPQFDNRIAPPGPTPGGPPANTQYAPPPPQYGAPVYATQPQNYQPTQYAQPVYAPPPPAGQPQQQLLQPVYGPQGQVLGYQQVPVAPQYAPPQQQVQPQYQPAPQVGPPNPAQFTAPQYMQPPPQQQPGYYQPGNMSVNGQQVVSGAESDRIMGEAMRIAAANGHITTLDPNAAAAAIHQFSEAGRASGRYNVQ